MKPTMHLFSKYDDADAFTIRTETVQYNMNAADTKAFYLNGVVWFLNLIS
jgi:hypothetical protein